MCGVRDLFHVYLNRCEFNFLRLHIYLRNKETQQTLRVIVSIQCDESF